MKLAIFEMLKNVADESNREKKKELLKKYVIENPVLGTILDYSFDHKIKFLLPEGTPPYKENEFIDTHGQLFRAARRFYLFVEGGAKPPVPQMKREQLFIGLLEELHPEDAKVVLRMKDKKSPYPGVTQRLVEETFGINYDLNRPKKYKKEKNGGKNDQKRSESRKGKASGSSAEEAEKAEEEGAPRQ